MRCSIVMAWSLVAACSVGPPAVVAPRPPVCDLPEGDPGMMQTTPGPIDAYGFHLFLSPPQPCLRGQRWRLSSTGRRRLVPPQEPLTCQGRPDASDTCDSVALIDFRMDVDRQLGPIGIPTKTSLVFDDICPAPMALPAPGRRMRLVLQLEDWSQADAALRTLVDRMRAWRIADAVELIVAPRACGATSW